MAYSTYEDVLHQIPLEELTELTTESGDTPDLQVVEEAIARADSEIESYCGVRYSVPISPVPPLLRTLSVDMALYHMYSRRSTAPAVRRVKYTEAVSLLREIATGAAVLTGTEKPRETSDHDVAVLTSNSRLFTRDSLAGW